MVTFQGVFAIPPTPFHDDGRIDVASLDRCIDFCLEAGAHGVVTPVVASEAAALDEAERMEITRLTCSRIDGRVPVVIGVSAASQERSVSLARHAREVGADAVIAMPPSDGGDIEAFYEALARVVDPLPVWVQHYPGPGGTVMPPAQLAALFDIPGVDWLKEETANAPQTMTRVAELAGDRLQGMMGGMGGRYLLDEAARGACGTMPACEVVDVHVRIWNAIDRGDWGEASALHIRLLPLLNFEAMYAFPVWKEVLKRRGVIASVRTRIAGAAVLDRQSHRELDRLLSEIDDLLA